MTKALEFINTYTDTRGLTQKPLTFTEAIVKGIAEGGGLFVPLVVPRLTLDEIVALGELPYAAQAAAIYKRFGVDLPADTIDALMTQAYGDTFDDPAIAPITEPAPGTFVLELWHGPTSAFKDMALQCLPVFFSAAIDQLRSKGSGNKVDETDEENAAVEATETATTAEAAATEAAATHDFLILVATSGDTGKAALEGFKDRKHTGIVVFYPHGGVSDIQFRQMATQTGENVGVFGVEGNFDDCQTAVKAAFDDAAFNELLAADHNLQLSSANSINWGRLLPQIVYYVSAYSQLIAQGALLAGAALDVCVPTGNFGNILAAYYAKELGVPIGQLFCASNENRVLTDFINTGVYDISEREFTLTPSPSMDILVSSNLERQLYELTGRDPEAIRSWMDDLRTKRSFRVDKGTFAALRENFCADWVNNDESLATIREVFETHGYLLDPHTAVAWKVAERLRGGNPVLVVSTAHWAKFGTDVYRALVGIPADGNLPSDVAALSGSELNELLSKDFKAGSIPSRLAELAAAPIRFSEVCAGTTEGIEHAVSEWLQG
jgi:threonine synthase